MFLFSDLHFTQWYIHAVINQTNDLINHLNSKILKTCKDCFTSIKSVMLENMALNVPRHVVSVAINPSATTSTDHVQGDVVLDTMNHLVLNVNVFINLLLYLNNMIFFFYIVSLETFFLVCPFFSVKSKCI